MDGRDEAIAPGGDILDVFCAVLAVTQSSPERPELHADIVWRDRQTRPGRPHQSFRADDITSILDQDRQQVERPAPQNDPYPGPLEGALTQVKSEWAEANDLKILWIGRRQIQLKKIRSGELAGR